MNLKVSLVGFYPVIYMHMKALLYVVWLNKLWDFHTKASLLAPKRMKQFYVYKDIRISKLLISEEKT